MLSFVFALWSSTSAREAYLRTKVVSCSWNTWAAEGECNLRLPRVPSKYRAEVALTSSKRSLRCICRHTLHDIQMWNVAHTHVFFWLDHDGKLCCGRQGDQLSLELARLLKWVRVATTFLTLERAACVWWLRSPMVYTCIIRWPKPKNGSAGLIVLA